MPETIVPPGEGMTLEEVGQVLGVSRQRVEQIEKRALEKLRKRPPRELQELISMSAELRRNRTGCGVVQSRRLPSAV